jgi:hypothetical protein
MGELVKWVKWGRREEQEPAFVRLRRGEQVHPPSSDYGAASTKWMGLNTVLDGVDLWE